MPTRADWWLKMRTRELFGYATFEPENRYVSDLAMRPNTSLSQTNTLLRALRDKIVTIGGDWSELPQCPLLTD